MTRVLRERRLAKALSLEQVAFALELSVREYFDREQGRLPFTSTELGVLSRLLGLNLEAQIAATEATTAARPAAPAASTVADSHAMNSLGASFDPA